jgi:hypothetical protein
MRKRKERKKEKRKEERRGKLGEDLRGTPMEVHDDSLWRNSPARCALVRMWTMAGKDAPAQHCLRLGRPAARQAL